MPRQRLTPRSEVLLNRARELRDNMTKPQARLWSKLRADQLGVRFRREHRVGPFIADIACPALKLVIEVDGDSHNEREDYDEARTAALKSLGYQVIRFTNTDVNSNLDGVVEFIAEYCTTLARRPSPPPSPRVQGEGGINLNRSSNK